MFDSILMILVANLQLSAPKLIISGQFSDLQMVQVNAEDLIIQGNEKFKVGDYPGAITDYTEAIRLNSQESSAYYNRAAAAFKLQKVEQTLADLTEALRLNPEYAEAYYLRGLVISESLGDNQTALQDFNRAIQINPNDANAYFKRGNARYRLGDQQGGLEDYTQTIRLTPEDADAYFNRGVGRYQLGDRPGAIADLQQAAKFYQKQGNVTGYQKVLDALQKVQ